MKIRGRWRVGIGLAAAMLVVGCGSGAPSLGPSVGPTAAAQPTATPASAQTSPSQAPLTAAPTSVAAASAGPAATNAVTIVDFGFRPGDVTVKAGTTVTWTNHGRTHTVTADAGSFDSGRIASGGTFSMTFKKAGTFAYHCAIHPTMMAQVVVTP